MPDPGLSICCGSGVCPSWPGTGVSVRLVARTDNRAAARDRPTPDENLMPKKRPPGVSSRMTRAPGKRHPWITNGLSVDLPVIVDWVNVDPGTGAELVRIEATIDLVDGTPAIISMSLVSSVGLDLVTLQRDFPLGFTAGSGNRTRPTVDRRGGGPLRGGFSGRGLSSQCHPAGADAPDPERRVPDHGGARISGAWSWVRSDPGRRVLRVTPNGGQLGGEGAGSRATQCAAGARCCRRPADVATANLPPVAEPSISEGDNHFFYQIKLG